MNNFPAQQLVFIGPTIFIILMILIPVLGFVGGWKRAVYWGGGNFIFFAIGLGLWFACNHVVGSLLGGLINSMTKDILTDAQAAELGASMAAPAFFFVHILIANLILLLVYLLWYRKWAMLGKYNTQKWEIKKSPLSKRIGHNAIGAVALPVLLLPTTLSLTQGILYATTSQTPRAHDRTARQLHDGLVKLGDAFSWFSYYGITDSARNYDGLYSTLSLDNTTIKFGFDEQQEEVKALDAINRVISAEGLVPLFMKLHEYKKEFDVEQERTFAEGIIETIDLIAKKWNQITKQTNGDAVAFFSSNVITEAIIDMLKFNLDDPQLQEKIDLNTFDLIYNMCLGKVEQSYELGYWTISGTTQYVPFPCTIHKMNITSRAYDNLVKGLKQFFDYKILLDPHNKPQLKIFNKRMNQLVNFVFNKK